MLGEPRHSSCGMAARAAFDRILYVLPASTAEASSGCQLVATARYSSFLDLLLTQRADVRHPPAVHNAGLSFLSAILLFGVLYELSGYWLLQTKKGYMHVRSGIRFVTVSCNDMVSTVSSQRRPPQAIWTIYCDPAPHQSRDGQIMFWYYMNYFTKARGPTPPAEPV